MAFHFKRKEPVRQGIRRLATERIESALECLEDLHRAEAVHELRKDIKKVRAVLRLASAHIPRKAYRRQTAILRKAARELSATRDAYVKGSALKHLSHHSDGCLRPKTRRHLRRAFAGEVAKAERKFKKRSRGVNIKQGLRRIRKQLDSVELTAKGWKAIRTGIKNTYACGRRAYHDAAEAPSPERLHGWRKLVKVLWYHLRLLQPICPSELKPLAEEVKELGECLGDDHDLFLLQQALEDEHGLGLQEADILMLTSLIEKRQRELRVKAMETGAQLYSEKPADFCRPLTRYWHAWRSGKNRRTPDCSGRRKNKQ